METLVRAKKEESFISQDLSRDCGAGEGFTALFPKEGGPLVEGWSVVGIRKIAVAIKRSS